MHAKNFYKFLPAHMHHFLHDFACTGAFGMPSCTLCMEQILCAQGFGVILHALLFSCMHLAGNLVCTHAPGDFCFPRVCTSGYCTHKCTKGWGHPSFPRRAFCTHQNFAQTRAPRAGDVLTPVGGFCMQEGFACMKGFLHACTEGFVHACMHAPRVFFFNGSMDALSRRVHSCMP